MMGVKGADRAIEFAEILLRVDGLKLPSKPMREDGNLLAQGCGRGCLAVRPRQHRHSSHIARQGIEAAQERARLWLPDLAHGIAKHHGISKIIDVV